MRRLTLRLGNIGEKYSVVRCFIQRDESHEDILVFLSSISLRSNKGTHFMGEFIRLTEMPPIES
jgi:hypothetical protein